MNKIKIVILGLAHPHAATLYKTLAQYPDEVEFLGYADVPPYDDMPREERKKHLGKEAIDVLREYENWEDLVSLGPDLAIVTVDNRACGDLMCKLLSLGIAVVNEKPMTMDYADAKRVAECAKKNGVPYYVCANSAASAKLAESLIIKKIRKETAISEFK